jgi:hypothetical protein
MSMTMIKNEKGIALVTALMFTLLTLGIIMTLLYMITQGTKVTAANKSYKTALEASYGATDMIAKDILPNIFKNMTTATRISDFASGSTLSSLGFAVSNSDCLANKSKYNTSDWNHGGTCTADSADMSSIAATTLPDMTFNLKADNDSTGYKVYAKIVDTRCGGDPAIGQKCTNSDAGGIEGLDSGNSVSSTNSAITVVRRPAYYRLEVQGERAANPSEKSKLSILYAY